VNCNPFGPPPVVLPAAERANWERLPDSNATALRKSLSQLLGVDPACVVAGSGSVELIRFLALACFGPGDTVVVPQPTFGEYEISLRIAGATVLAPREPGLDRRDVSVESLERLLRDSTGGRLTRGIFLCNPNNPTGTYLSREEVKRLLDALPDGLVILDEAYLPFVNGAWRSLDLLDRGNLVVLRSLTKDFALGGLRLGYAVGPESLMDVLRRALPPWNVNAVAQEAGVLALQDPGYPERCRPAITESRDYLMAELTALGLRVLPSRTNYFLVEMEGARNFRRDLLQEGFLVRDCNSFGLPSYIRISARTLPESRRLIEAAGRLLTLKEVRH
ncbi:MAG: histidinol-phosphate transaminase, partial [Dehalococcoidia bacterium]|nr:histidinol-phosphate transaminase [Dehalococcoidia bacterium]